MISAPGEALIAPYRPGSRVTAFPRATYTSEGVLVGILTVTFRCVIGVSVAPGLRFAILSRAPGVTDPEDSTVVTATLGPRIILPTPTTAPALTLPPT